MGWRPILDVSILNTFVHTQWYRMVILAAIIPSLGLGDWFASLDPQDAYFHLAMNPSPRHVLCFVVGRDHCRYHILHFSFFTAPGAWGYNICYLQTKAMKILNSRYQIGKPFILSENYHFLAQGHTLSAMKKVAVIGEGEGEDLKW